MKKSFALIMTCLIAMATLTGCALEKKADPTLVTVWTYYNGTAKDAFDNIVKLFNDTVGLEKNIVVEAYTQGDVSELASAVVAAANSDVGAEEMPNIFSAYPDNAMVIDDLGCVVDLEKYFSEKELAEYRAEFIEGGRIGEENLLKIIPVAKSTENLFLNKSDFDEFLEGSGEIPDLSTWEGLADAAASYYYWSDSLTPELNDGKALFGMDSMANFMIISAKQLGYDIYSVQDGVYKLNLPKEVARTIWDNFYVPFVNGYYASIGRFRSDDAKRGDVLAYAGSTASAAYFPTKIETGKDAYYDIECAVLPYPHFAMGNPFIVEQGAGMAIAKSDPVHEKASAEFLKWFCGKERNLSFAASTGYLPVKNDALNYEEFKAVFDKLPAGENSQVVIDSAKTAFESLESYSFYSAKPFENSYDARGVLERSLLDYAKADLAAIQQMLTQNTDRIAVVAQYVTEENFTKWYDAFVAETAACLSK